MRQLDRPTRQARPHGVVAALVYARPSTVTFRLLCTPVSTLESGRWSLSLPGADGRARARARGAVVAFSGRGRVSTRGPWTRAVDRSFVVPGANAEEACVSLASKYDFLRALLLNATELELSPIQKFLRLSPYAYAKGSNLHPRHDSPSRLHGPARAQSSDPARPQHTCTIREDSATRLRAPPSRGAGTRRTNEE